MKFQIGDYVRGSGLHINSLRMEDVGVVLGPEQHGYLVAWFSDTTIHFATAPELILVRESTL